ncbi:hypothetical protein BRAS3843_1640029 [Bradyrhizobium sp. STM 3843]|uniref:hypothetical protein n=1 Tax=Bradyrhizobium sp. STM 3843 TaxID=551947 RepID=UPI0002406C39|nr:hypothetical protein [Bradyrhizobium sp. STM 3843]CCE06219.1 hypothetical protein BRAS3843_1640029 [Bradyrhizobium sp. STM 3843]
MRSLIEGVVYVTIIRQVSHLLGIAGASGNFFFPKPWHTLQHSTAVSAAPVIIGILSLREGLRPACQTTSSPFVA